MVQPSLFDSTRAPDARRTGWAYCHVPNASGFDASHLIEEQIERCAPGFRDCVLFRASKDAAVMERYNENYLLDSTGWRGAWDVRLLGRQERTAQSVWSAGRLSVRLPG